MTLRILEPGLCTLLVDFGRPKSRNLGVPVGGAADRGSLTIANALVGNPCNAAALEVALSGPTLQADCELACVVYGASFDLFSDRQQLAAGKTFTLQPGEKLRIGAASSGVRAYLCVRGGLKSPVILGSRSSLGPVRVGMEFPCSPGVIQSRFIPWQCTDSTEPVLLRAIAGPQVEWFNRDEFFGRKFCVSSDSNRMGLRLHGDPMAVPDRELASEPVCPGSVQVTRDGKAIILGIDGQTIGGYPKIAQVVTADWDLLGQLRPGSFLHFEEVSLEMAGMLYHQRQTMLRGWAQRLQMTL